MWLNYVLAALSGVAYIVSCAPINQYYLMWFAFLPLYFALNRLKPEEKTPWRLFRLGLTTSFFMGATGYYWIIHATQSYGGIPLPFAFLLFLAFCFTNQLQMPAFVLFRSWLSRTDFFKSRVVVPALLLGVIYGGLDSFIPKLFADTVGSAFYNATWVRQLADIGGPIFLTFVGVTVNELLAAALFQRKTRALAAVAIITVLVCAYGYARNDQFAKLKTAHARDPFFKAALIQGNIGDFEKVAAERGETNAINQVLGQYLKLSEDALKETPPPDAVVWPETAYPAIFDRPFSTAEAQMELMLKELLVKIPGYLIFGGYDKDKDARGLEYNSIFFIKAGTPLEKRVYHKNMLLMFGETLPFSEEYPEMKNWFPTMGFFGRGAGPEVVRVKNHAGDEFSLAPSICYEGLFVDFSAAGALLGADALINVTNDSWFGEHGEPYQHLSLTRFRSIETRLPMIRSTNTGFTVWIDPTGEQIRETEMSKAAVLNTEVQKRVFPLSPYLVMAKIFGTNWFNRLIELLTLAIACVFWLKNARLKVARKTH